MSGEERLLHDIRKDTLGDLYHELRVALYQYDAGQITAEEYNAKVEETQKFLESIKFSPEVKL